MNLFLNILDKFGLICAILTFSLFVKAGYPIIKKEIEKIKK